jgi:hypothetical protein
MLWPLVLILEPGKLEEETFSAILIGSFLESLQSLSARKETSHVNDELYLLFIVFCSCKQFFCIFLNQAVHKMIIHKS